MSSEGISYLISRVALRDRSAFDALYSSTSAKLFGVCLRILKDRGEAEDALQDVYIKIWNRADRYRDGEASPMSWLIAIARNQSIDRLRSRPVSRKTVELSDDFPEPGASPEALSVAAGETRRIDTCLEELDKERAGAVRGAYLNGESYEELAKRYTVPLNTMRTWLRRSLLKLKECLER